MSFTEIIIIGLLIYVLYKILFKKKITADFSPYDLNGAIKHNLQIDEVIKDSKKNSYGKSQSIKYKSKIPKGYKIKYDIRDIVLGYNIEVAQKFINSKEQTLMLAREPDNEYDENAIAILSYYGKLGYVHEYMAAALVMEMHKEFIIRHQYIWVGEKRGYLHIQLLGKK